MKFFFKAWKNAFVFSGRATRPEYWYFVLFDTLAAVWIGGFFTIAGTFLSIDERYYQIPLYIYGVASILPAWSVTCRRLHDIGISGLWSLAPLGAFVLCECVILFKVLPPHIASWLIVLPYLLGVASYVACIFDGQRGQNLFGRTQKGAHQK